MDSIHLDVMDGHFVDNITLGPVVVGALRPHASVPFHSHLMISRPLAYIDAFADAGSDLIVAHVEADDDPGAVIDAIRAAGKAPGLSLNPDTPVDDITPYLDRIELLLVMTVQPGWGGQPFRDRRAAQDGLAARRDRAAGSRPADRRGWRRQPGDDRTTPTMPADACWWWARGCIVMTATCRRSSTSFAALPSRMPTDRCRGVPPRCHPALATW